LKTSILIFFLLVTIAVANAVGTISGPYTITVTSDPAVVQLGQDHLTFHVTDSSGHPLSNLQIEALTQMPGMPMGERNQVAIPDSSHPGSYISPASFAMAGTFNITLHIAGPLGNSTALIPIGTSENTAVSTSASTSQFPILDILVIAIAVSLIVFIVIRLRNLGVHANKSSHTKKAIWQSVILLGFVTIIAIYAVNHWRRKGSMTLMQAQTMSMDMPPPSSNQTVTLVQATRGVINNSSVFPGQAAAYNTIAVTARVTGTITSLPVYVGDKVHAGEVLAELDTSQIDPQIRAAESKLQEARTGYEIAKQQLKVSQANVKEVKAEESQVAAAILSSKSGVSQAQQSYSIAQDEAKSAIAEVQVAKANLVAVGAQARYWQAEFDREGKLFKSGAVSQEEYQSELSQNQAAQSNLLSAKSKLSVANLAVETNQQKVLNAKSAITAANAELAKSNSMLQAHMSHYESQSATSDASRLSISQAQESVLEAQAQLDALTTQASYSTLVAPASGIVSSRNLSPGTLVSPGQMVLQISQFNPIRLQANVSAEDLAKLFVGDQVEAVGAHQQRIMTKISSISPIVDPQSRQGIVEAVVPNPQLKFFPGEFISLRINRGSKSGLYLPSSTVHQGENNIEYVWLAKPIQGASGTFTVTRSNVKVGPTNGTQAIIEGIPSDSYVVDQNSDNLTDGETVTAQTSPASNSSLNLDKKLPLTNSPKFSFNFPLIGRNQFESWINMLQQEGLVSN